MSLRYKLAPPDRRRMPRRYARIPSPERIRAWLARAVDDLEEPLEATGVQQNATLLWHVLEYLAANPGLEPEDLELRVNRDKQWRDRPRARTAAERLAYMGLVLYDYRTKHMSVVWVLPRESVVREAEKTS